MGEWAEHGQKHPEPLALLPELKGTGAPEFGGITHITGGICWEWLQQHWMSQWAAKDLDNMKVVEERTKGWHVWGTQTSSLKHWDYAISM